MKTAVFLSLCLAVAPVPAVQLDGNVLTITDEDRAACESEGGCHYFITKAYAMRMIEEMAKKRAGNCMGTARFGDDT